MSHQFKGQVIKDSSMEQQDDKRASNSSLGSEDTLQDAASPGALVTLPRRYKRTTALVRTNAAFSPELPEPAAPMREVPAPTAALLSGILPDMHKLRVSEKKNELIKTDSWLFKGIQNIGDLHLTDVVWSTNDVVSRRKLDVLVEYTWLQGPSFPAVYVPGNTRIWNRIAPGVELKAAPASPIIDEHRLCQPDFLFEPTFRALQAGGPHDDLSPLATNFRHVDIVSDAETLALLFSFLNNPDPVHIVPFRLELSTVRNTLFLSTAVHRSLGHTDNGNGRCKSHLPPWVRHAVTARACASTRLLPFSAGHFRVVRYGMGSVVLVVRTKVDWAIDNRTVPEIDDMAVRLSMRGVPAEKDHHGEGKRETFKTMIKRHGRGTLPQNAGITSVRLPGWDPAVTIANKMPVLWFGRVPFLADGVVSSDTNMMQVETKETKIFDARDSYGKWEHTHQGPLKMMAGLLPQLKEITRALGGNCVLVGDPGQRSLQINKPVLKSSPLPEIVIAQVWGDKENPCESAYDSSVESEFSELSQLSGTPPICEDWELKRKPPALGAQRAGGFRGKVTNWLDGQNKAYETDSEKDDATRSSPSTLKQVRLKARNPCRGLLRGVGRSTRPSSSNRFTDGAADLADDEVERADSNKAMSHKKRIAARVSSTAQGMDGAMDIDVPPRRLGILNSTYIGYGAGDADSDEEEQDISKHEESETERELDVEDVFFETEETERELRMEDDEEDEYEEEVMTDDSDIVLDLLKPSSR